MNSPYALGIRRASLVVSGVDVVVAGSAGDLYFESLEQLGQLFEPAVAVAGRHLGPDAVVIDVGASIGLVTAALLPSLPTGRIVCFEPEPRALDCLRETLRSEADRVTIVPAAAGREVGVARFHQDPNGTAWGMLVDREPSVEVPITTVDVTLTELAVDRVDMVKIDVEGFELDVLRGARETIERHRPLMVVEINPYCLWRHGRTLPQDLVAELCELYPFVTAVHGDGRAVPVKGRSVDDLLYELGTSGGLADLVASDRELELEGLLVPATDMVGEQPVHQGQQRSLGARVMGRLRRR